MRSADPSLVLGQEIYFTAFITYLMFFYTILSCLPIFSSILAYQAASMGTFWISYDSD